MDHDSALRAHIRRQLLDYVNEHINIDHIAYTEHVATQLLAESLKPVALFDSTILALPEEPIDLLCRQYGITAGDRKYIPEERLTFTQDTKRYMLGMHQKFSFKGRTPSERHMLEIDSDRDFELPRPVSPPVMTRKAHNNTPLLYVSKKSSPKVLEQSLVQHLEMLDLLMVKPSLGDDEDRFDQENILGLHFQMSAVALEKMQTFNSLVTRNRRASKNMLSHSAREFLYDEDVDHSLPEPMPQPLSPPLFPRLQAGSTLPKPITGHWDKAAISNFVRTAAPAPIPDPDEQMDTAREHMAIIDGWTTYIPNEIATLITTSQPPSLRSSSSGRAEEIDELVWNSTPPDPQPPPDVLIASYKLDDVEIPRAHRPRNGLLLNSSSIALPTRESLRDFLHPLPDIWDPSPREKNSLSRPTAPSASASLLGQPPTESGQDDDLDPTVRSGPQTELREMDIDLDLVIESIYASVRGLEPESIIMNVQNAEASSDPLHLEVPRLPEPNVHSAPRITVPTNFGSMINAPKKAKASNQSTETATHPMQSANAVNLAKVTGLASLNMQLSWRPIISGTTIPTHEELAKADLSADDKTHTSAVVEYVAAKVSSQRTPPYLRGTFEGSSPTSTSDIDRKDGLILTREERQLVQGNLQPRVIHATPDSVHKANTSPIVHHAPTFSSPTRPSPESLISNRKRRAESAFEDAPVPPSKHHRAQWNPHANGTPTRPLSQYVDPNQTLGNQDSVPFTRTAPPSTAAQLKDIELLTLPAAGTSATPLTPLTPPSSTPAPEIQLVRKNVTLAIADFRQLKGNLSTSNEELHPNEALTDRMTIASPPLLSDPVTKAKSPPPVALNNAFSLPSYWDPPRSTHSYIASLDLIQKRALAALLSSPTVGRIDLVEHSSLNGTDAPDLILDPHTAIVFFPLLHLPSMARDLMKRLKLLSSSFSDILLVLEAYSSARSYGSAKISRKIARNANQSDANGSSKLPEREMTDIDVFSPPVILALKRFRRELAIERGLSPEVQPDSNVQLVCALNVEEAAMYARSWGDRAQDRCESDSRSIIWGSREWLMQDENEDASDLANFPGMNIFASTFILSYISADEFLTLDSEYRLHFFGPFIGVKRMIQLNDELDRRAELYSALSPSPGDNTLFMTADDMGSSTTRPTPASSTAGIDNPLGAKVAETSDYAYSSGQFLTPWTPL